MFYHHPTAQGISVMWPGNKIPAPWANTTEPNKLLQVRNVQTLAVITIYQNAHTCLSSNSLHFIITVSLCILSLLFLSPLCSFYLRHLIYKVMSPKISHEGVIYIRLLCFCLTFSCLVPGKYTEAKS